MSSDPSRSGAGGRERSLLSSEFGLRVLSALVLATGAIALTWAGVIPFLLLVIVCLGVLAWEWNRIAQSDFLWRDTVLHAAVVVAAAVLAGLEHPFKALAVIAIAAALGYAFDRRGRLAIGIVYLGLPAIAIELLRSDKTFGFEAVIFLLLVVWCADTMAYVAGKLIGGAKLAPSISPGKTWSGSIAGIVFPALLGFFFAKWLGQTDAVVLAFVAAVLALVSEIGDLAESAAKRAANMKDASQIIPGHGGLLDRLDAFLFAAMAAGLLVMVRDADNPGRALLIW